MKRMIATAGAVVGTVWLTGVPNVVAFVNSFGVSWQ